MRSIQELEVGHRDVGDRSRQALAVEHAAKSAKAKRRRNHMEVMLGKRASSVGTVAGDQGIAPTTWNTIKSGVPAHTRPALH
jgi:hypothetical protein